MTVPAYQDDRVTVYHGDCLDLLPTMAAGSVHAIVTDPPYGLEFMGKDWDRFGGTVQTNIHEGADDSHPFRNGSSRIWYGREGSAMTEYQAWCRLWAIECLRVLKPGGHMLAFGGTRTWHRLATAIEGAGFEIRDSIAWIYGSGFPKSLDVSKAIDKAAGAERDVIGEQVDRWTNKGTVLNFATDRPQNSIPVTGAPATDAAKQWAGWGTALKPAFEPVIVARKPLQGTVAATVLAHGTGALNVDACRVGTDTSRGDRYNGKPSDGRKSLADGSDDWNSIKHREPWDVPAGRWPPNVVLDDTAAHQLDQQSGTLTSGKMQPTHTTAGRNIDGPNAANGYVTSETYGDSGGASRFFPVFKYTPKAPQHERPTTDGTAHPTVKPLDLLRWLVRLVTPPAGIVLDPFAGTGTTGEAAIHEHRHAILIEREPDYLPLIRARLNKPMEIGFDFDTEADTK